MEAQRLDTVRLKDGSEYRLSGSWDDLTDKPLKTVQTPLLTEGELNFDYVSNYGAYIYETTDIALRQTWAGAWHRAIVTIDGVQYLPERREAGAGPYLGDALRLATGSPVTGEPYAFGVTNGAFVIALFADAVPEGPEAAQTHTVSLTLETDVMRSDYLPAPPEFDLTAMGLAAVSVGGSVSVTCDVAALRSAMDKGAVKLTLSYQAGVGVTAPVTMIGSAMKMAGKYQLSFVGVLGPTPMLFNVEVTETSVSAGILTLAVPSADSAAAQEG